MIEATETRSAVPAGRGEPNPKPSRARIHKRARLEPVTRWRIALQYAMGEKVEAIAAEHQIGPRDVSAIAADHGLPLRGCGRRPNDDRAPDVRTLRAYAHAQARGHRQAAEQWEALADLE